MPRFVICSRAGEPVTVTLTRAQLEAKRGVLEALVAGDDDHEIRLDDVGLGDLSAAEFARAVDAAFAPTQWEAVKAVADLREDGHAAAILEAVDWLGVPAVAALARAARRVPDPPAGDQPAEMIAGVVRARSADLDVPLRTVFRAGPPSALLGVLVGGSLAVRAGRGERLQWAVVQALALGDCEALELLWHLQRTGRLPVTLEDSADDGSSACRPEDFDGEAVEATPFFVAVTHGHRGVLEFLCRLRDDHGASIDLSDRRAFVQAAALGHRAVLELLWERRAKDAEEDTFARHATAAFVEAAKGGHVDTLEFLWGLRRSHGVPLDPTAEDNNVLFVEAAARGHVEVLRILWTLHEAREIVLDPTARSGAALLLAATNGHVDVLRFLRGLCVDHHVPINFSVMHFQVALVHGRVEAAQFLWSVLAAQGVPAEQLVATPGHQTVWEEVAATGHSTALEYLWELHEALGIDVDPKGSSVAARRGEGSERGYVALKYASTYGNLPVVQFLVRLHCEGKVRIEPRELEEAAANAWVDSRERILQVLVPDAVDVGAEIRQLLESCTPDSSLDRRLEVARRVRDLAALPTTRESVATTPDLVRHLLGWINAAIPDVRACGWDILDVLSRWTPALDVAWTDGAFLAGLCAPLGSDTTDRRLQAFRVLLIAARSSTLSLTDVSVDPDVAATLSRRVAEGLIDEEPGIRFIATQILAELSLVEGLSLPDAIHDRGMDSLVGFIERGSRLEQRTALRALHRNPSFGGRRAVLSRPGLFLTLFNFRRDMHSPEEIAAFNVLFHLVSENKDWDAAEPSLSLVQIREVTAVAVPHLQRDVDRFLRSWAIQLLSMFTADRSLVSVVANEPGLLQRVSDLLSDEGLVDEEKAHAIELVVHLAEKPCNIEAFVRTPGLLQVLAQSREPLSFPRRRLRRALDLLLTGPRPDGAHAWDEEEVAALTALQWNLAFEATPSDRTWCTELIRRISERHSSHTVLVRVPGLFRHFVALLNDVAPGADPVNFFGGFFDDEEEEPDAPRPHDYADPVHEHILAVVANLARNADHGPLLAAEPGLLPVVAARVNHPAPAIADLAVQVVAHLCRGEESVRAELRQLQVPERLARGVIGDDGRPRLLIVDSIWRLVDAQEPSIQSVKRALGAERTRLLEDAWLEGVGGERAGLPRGWVRESV